MIVFLGLAGSGKSTQSQLLAKHLDCPWLSTGQMLREFVKDREVQEKMLAGEILDDSLLFSLLEQQLNKLGKKEFILDGSPRTMKQAIWLVKKIKHHEINLTAVIHLQASHAEVKKRLLKRGRPDDTPAAIEERFKEYEKAIIPILDYFRSHNFKVYEINAEQPPAQVDQEIIDCLKDVYHEI